MNPTTSKTINDSKAKTIIVGTAALLAYGAVVALVSYGVSYVAVKGVEKIIDKIVD